MSIKKFTLTRQRTDSSIPFYPELPNAEEKLSVLINFIRALPGVIEYNTTIQGDFCINEIVFDSDILSQGDAVFTSVDQDPLVGPYHLEIIKYYQTQAKNFNHYKNGKTWIV